ncbi:formate dehydrogenase accessory sulfurtransferase FdhD [Microvirga lotononidis]|uniref:Sulfur carrier protein FdhD n=1 Tax=Microvirga lotononidis TaxID=864069 RepID=I4YXY2_9HYPH|nr:formate dehydrogenase accessory sulfurtransferase FdhD [Microvirga lotononidis]EIM28824.1 formate dehydrogenase family accessory protein FdhD [Microvirga lotononidis]WQO25448.1 formate dehydrogenase accessory sulfurtransferase FdhD [Microvirga lotononidis]
MKPVDDARQENALNKEHEDSAYPTACQEPITVIPFNGTKASRGARAIASEVPVNLVYGGIPFAVMMTTPSDLEDFALGFSLTEGVIKHPHDIRGIRIEQDERGLRLAIDLVPDRLHEHLARKRALSGRTGCGLCGIDDLKSLPQARANEGNAPVIALPAIQSALLGLDRRQALNELTHAVHAAAWADLDGAIRFVREDVGRHNALDKLIGAACRAGTEPDSGFVIVTSRCSFELVEKVAAFGARTLVSISAPTSLALERARHLDITLIGIARRDSMTVFHGIDRISGAQPFGTQADI